MFRSKFGKVVSSTFQAPSWARNAHVQTIWPRYLIKKPELNTQNERISTPDGDFLDIAWCLPDDILAQSAKGVVVVFHGLEGSVNSHYARHLINRIKEDGFIVALMHFRGCSHESNMTPRAYHSGETVDPIQTISHVKQRYPNLPVFAVGYSLGGNMLLKLLSETAGQKVLCAAVAVSAPLLLAECALRMQRGFSRLYQHYLLNSMKNKLLEKMRFLDIRRSLNIDESKVKALSTFREFDQDVTAKLHGFEGADDYYAHCSAMSMLKNITTNTLVLHSRDDPFMTEAVVPSENQLSNSVAYELSEKGGHVGFLHGTPFRPKLWLQERISEFLEEQHQRILAAETTKKTEMNV
ncbi:hydrolase [Brumicola pallidula]|uniref:Alpha/beta hydrolase fold family protein n=1 Tax=Brumicola pallidula DSM 14239 = ACAM 615 TaxID=1121922 RepID=K6ZW76_9ALTE|nr:hydrolase [Glaciecola pallidula]GAC27575.1 alpha/beta hydrolase fold family protein [Glaciecola pallidula DSM 14239 = ACAM 615]